MQHKIGPVQQLPPPLPLGAKDDLLHNPYVYHTKPIMAHLHLHTHIHIHARSQVEHIITIIFSHQHLQHTHTHTLTRRVTHRLRCNFTPHQLLLRRFNKRKQSMYDGVCVCPSSHQQNTHTQQCNASPCQQHTLYSSAAASNWVCVCVCVLSNAQPMSSYADKVSALANFSLASQNKMNVVDGSSLSSAHICHEDPEFGNFECLVLQESENVDQLPVQSVVSICLHIK